MKPTIGVSLRLGRKSDVRIRIRNRIGRFKKRRLALDLGSVVVSKRGRSALSMLQHDVDPAPIFAAAFDNVPLWASLAHTIMRARVVAYSRQLKSRRSFPRSWWPRRYVMLLPREQISWSQRVSMFPVIVLMSLLARGLDVELEGLGTKKVRVSSTAGQLRYENGGIEDFQNPSNLKLTFIADFEPSLALPPDQCV